jgi:Skp family chaperone for outer membrane proteins
MLEKLKSDIRVAIKEVGKIKKYDAVLEKQVVYYGGTDISEDVVKFLSGVEKIELKK